jgi:ribosomal protein S18 acetylase RimI-like enzyme
MYKGELYIRGYRPEDLEPWLNLMAKLCEMSSAWEAVYLEHPSFHPDFDFIAIENGQVIGALAGHRINTKPQSFWSAEILGVHPDHQNKGVAKALINQASSLIQKNGEQILLWTRCTKARNWYLKAGYREVDRRHLETIPITEGELHILKKEGTKGWPLWAFATPSL